MAPALDPANLPLRDIHLPPPPPWWPPAPGWWVLLALALALLALALSWLRRDLVRRRWRSRVLEELERIAAGDPQAVDPAGCVAAVSALLRRAARLLDPAAAALPDEAWLRFLDARLPPTERASAPFHDGVGRALVELPWRRPDDPAFAALDRPALFALARRWLRHALAEHPRA